MWPIPLGRTLFWVNPGLLIRFRLYSKSTKKCAPYHIIWPILYVSYRRQIKWVKRTILYFSEFTLKPTFSQWHTLTLSHNMALIQVDFPFEVRPKKTHFIWSLWRISKTPLIFLTKSVMLFIGFESIHLEISAKTLPPI